MGVIFTPGGSFKDAQSTLSGQALKGIFKMNKYLFKFTGVSIKHKLELFDKLILPILNYGSEVWGFHRGDTIERIHTQFCKNVLGVKKSTQNDFVYGEVGRTSLINKRYFNIVRYWMKILYSENKKYIKIVYNMMLRDIVEYPNKKNWASLLRDLMYSMGFNNVWLAQGVGNQKVFLSIVKQRINDNFIQNWESRLDDSSRAVFYNGIRSFDFQPYLFVCNITKYRSALCKLRMSSHRLEVETGRWHKPGPTPRNE